MLKDFLFVLGMGRKRKELRRDNGNSKTEIGEYRVCWWNGRELFWQEFGEM